ncbi:hypothetical protein ACIQV3_26420 [Streptomyces sp. NPDC099050]
MSPTDCRTVVERIRASRTGCSPPPRAYQHVAAISVALSAGLPAAP